MGCHAWLCQVLIVLVTFFSTRRQLFSFFFFLPESCGVRIQSLGLLPAIGPTPSRKRSRSPPLRVGCPPDTRPCNDGATAHRHWTRPPSITHMIGRETSPSPTPPPLIGRAPVRWAGPASAQHGAADSRSGRIVSVTAALGVSQQKCQKQRTADRWVQRGGRSACGSVRGVISEVSVEAAQTVCGSETTLILDEWSQHASGRDEEAFSGASESCLVLIGS